MTERTERSEAMTKNTVKGYRNMLNMTQEDMAELLGITKQSYHNKERGQTQFTDSQRLKIKELFKTIKADITIDEIFYSD